MHFFHILASLDIKDNKDIDLSNVKNPENDTQNGNIGEKEGLHGIGITILIILIVALVCLLSAIIFGIVKNLRKRKEFQIVPTFDPDENVEDSEDEEIVAKFDDCNTSEQEPLI